MTLLAERATNEDGEQEMMKLIRYNITKKSSEEDKGNDVGSVGNSSVGG